MREKTDGDNGPAVEKLVGLIGGSESVKACTPSFVSSFETKRQRSTARTASESRNISRKVAKAAKVGKNEQDGL